MRISSEKGISVLISVGIMLVATMLGFVVATRVVTTSETHLGQLELDKAAAVNNAGMEYGLRKIYEGQTGTFPSVDFAGGTFSGTRVGTLVTITANYKNSGVAHTVTSPSEADCTRFDVTNASLALGGTRLQQIQFEKICLPQTTLDKMIVSWTNPGVEGLTSVRVGSTTIYNLPPVLNGITTELADFVLNSNNVQSFNEINFTSNMTGKQFTIVFVLLDGSNETYTFTPL